MIYKICPVCDHKLNSKAAPAVCLSGGIWSRESAGPPGYSFPNRAPTSGSQTLQAPIFRTSHRGRHYPYRRNTDFLYQ